MNRFTKISILSAALVAIIGAAAAPTVAKGRHQLDFEAIDKNADGFLTLEEVGVARDQKFDEIDTNQDGSLSEDEMKVHRDARHAAWLESRGERSKAAFERMDTDKNGAISPAELNAAMEKRDENRKRRHGKSGGRIHQGFMKHIDSNADGKITKAELTGAYTTRIFERLDTNKDSRISKAEAEEARKNFRHRWLQD